jgi:hypothetical protein
MKEVISNFESVDYSNGIDDGGVLTDAHSS